MKKNIVQALAIAAGALATTAVSTPPTAPIAPITQERPMGRPMDRMRGPGPRGHGGPGRHMQMLRDRVTLEQNPAIKAEAEDLLIKIKLGDENVEALWIIRRENMQKLHQLLGLPEMGPGKGGPGRHGMGGPGGRGPGRGPGYGRGGRGMMGK